jgi:response regulator RpfG family c-di-GMP phosphodiesterase
MKQKEEALLNENNRPKVLIVDDMRENVELMEAYLAVEPYKVFCAYGGKEALRIVDKEKPDIVLLDVMMPEVNGYEVCKILKENPETQFIPVLMLTALSELEDRIKGIELKTRVKSLLRVKYLHDRLVADRDSLEVKNRVQSILTAVIPTLLQSVSNEEKKVIINQMTGMVEKTLLEMYHFENREMDLAYAGNVCAEIMNQLGGSFYSTMGENDKIWIVKGTRCPWKGEEARKNPILCTLTRKIFSNITLKVDSGCRLEALKTIGNRNDCCEFLIKAA